MNNYSMEESEDNISWWIGLRVVYAVWFGQLWYWEELRPYLATAKPKQKLFISTALVTLIINTLLFIASGFIIQSFGLDFDWQLIGMAVGVINLVLLGTSTYMMLPKKPEMQSLNQWGIPSLVVMTTTGTLAIILGLQNFQLIGLAFGFATGVSLGMSLGIVMLMQPTFKESFFNAFPFAGFISVFLFMIPIVDLNIYLICVTPYLLRRLPN